MYSSSVEKIPRRKAETDARSHAAGKPAHCGDGGSAGSERGTRKGSLKGWRGFLGRPPRRVGSDPDGRDRKETNTEITIQAGKVNKFRLEKGGKTFTLTFDPTQHTGYREAVRAAFTLLIEAVGKSKAWKVYTESIQKLAGDNSLWSKDGKWIGEGYSYKTTL